MKKSRNKAYLIIGALALVAFGLTYALLSGVVAPKPVVVARVDLAAGTRLTADLLELRTLPADAIPDGAYTTIAEAEDKVLTTARVAGDPITAYVAGESGAASGIPAQLAPDCVAISIKVDQATGLAGVLRPGQTVTVIAILDPSAIPQDSLQSISAPALELPTTPVPGTTPTPIPPTPTPEPPLSPAARIVITGLRVLVVPQSFRYEESVTLDGSDPFLPARTTTNLQQASVILLEAPVTPVEVAPGLLVSPAELLALLNQTAVIHLALEPAGGLTIRVEAVPAVDLAELYEGITGYDLNP
ncbi:MAG: Flp pilus assembly protein CpaB [Chloroflexi bacterium]|nr:Flp pilus assembly protein CpaB [Chloroflexota bacterium]